jgi:hypothetical protein
MKKLFVFPLITLLVLLLLVNSVGVTPVQQYWSHYQNPPRTTALPDLFAGQRYWSYYLHPRAITPAENSLAKRPYWFHYQFPPVWSPVVER